MRTHLSERASKELIEIMQHYGFNSTNHTLNVMIGNLYKTITPKPINEVNNNASEQPTYQQ
jgi:hypothetical protein